MDNVQKKGDVMDFWRIYHWNVKIRPFPTMILMYGLPLSWFLHLAQWAIMNWKDAKNIGHKDILKWAMFFAPFVMAHSVLWLAFDWNSKPHHCWYALLTYLPNYQPSEIWLSLQKYEHWTIKCSFTFQLHSYFSKQICNSINNNGFTM